MPSEIPYCTLTKQYKDIANELERISYGYTNAYPPCRGIEKVTKGWTEFDLNGTCNNELRLRFKFEDTFYKQVELVQAYNFQTLVGNGGKFRLKKIGCKMEIIKLKRFLLSLIAYNFFTSFCFIFRGIRWPFLRVCATANT